MYAEQKWIRAPLLRTHQDVQKVHIAHAIVIRHAQVTFVTEQLDNEMYVVRMQVKQIVNQMELLVRPMKTVQVIHVKMDDVVESTARMIRNVPVVGVLSMSVLTG